MPLAPLDVATELVKIPEFSDVLGLRELGRFFRDRDIELEYLYTDASTKPLIRSGDLVEGLVVIRQGTVITWTNPPSFLEPPFLIGQHELLMPEDNKRWMASYSPMKDLVYLSIPLELMVELIDVFPKLRDRLQQTVSRLLSRFFWTSLAVVGSPESKVAAALMSRLVLDGKAFGTHRVVPTDQRIIARLTNTSRTGVYQGLTTLLKKGLISVDAKERSRQYITGPIRIPSVDKLRTAAESSFAEKVVTRHTAQG